MQSVRVGQINRAGSNQRRLTVRGERYEKSERMWGASTAMGASVECALPARQSQMTSTGGKSIEKTPCNFNIGGAYGS